jgi:polar amino acid transport system substrate-binding protein
MTHRKAARQAGVRGTKRLVITALASGVVVLAAAALLAACGTSGTSSGSSSPQASGAASSPSAGQTASLTSEELAWLANKGTLKVGAFDDYPPFGFVDKSGAAVGIAVDYWKLVAERLGVQVAFSPVKFADQLQGLKDGTYDSLQGIFPLDSRKQWFAFTSSFLDIPTRIYADGATGATSLDALKGVNVAVVDGDSGQEIADKAGLKTLVVASYPEAIEAVAKGKAAAAIMDQLVGDYYVQKFGYSGRIQARGAAVADGKMTLPVRKDDTMLLGILEKGRSMVTSEELNDIVSKWMGST